MKMGGVKKKKKKKYCGFVNNIEWTCLVLCSS